MGADDPALFEIVREALQRWVDRGPEAAAETLETISPASVRPVRESFPAPRLAPYTATAYGVPATADVGGDGHADKDRALAELGRRHGYRCAYCDRLLLAPLTVAVLGLGFQARGLWPTDWRFVASHPVIIPNYPALEHVWPKKRGGHHTAYANLVMACWRCNATKGDRMPEELGWAPTRHEPGDADGLIPLARRAWDEHGLVPRDLTAGHHKPWPSAATIWTWHRTYTW